MKICPNCGRTFDDDSHYYCQDDGAVLTVSDANGEEETATASVAPTSSLKAVTENISVFGNSPGPQSKISRIGLLSLFMIGGFIILAIVGVTLYFYNKPISGAEGITTSRVTSINFNKLIPGMSYQTVTSILGEGQEKGNSTTGVTRTYQWKASDSQYIEATFAYDKLVQKVQFGLESPESDSKTSDITLTKYQQLKLGMTYEDVVAILGDGQEVENIKLGDVSQRTYRWKGEGSTSIAATFSNGRLAQYFQIGLE